MTDKVATISIRRNEDETSSVFWNDTELETVENVMFNVATDEQAPYIQICFEVPAIDIKASIQDIQLSTEAYRRCGKCGKWLVPSIDNNLETKKVTAEYVCLVPRLDGSCCNWKEVVEIEDWNNGVQDVKALTKENGTDGRE